MLPSLDPALTELSLERLRRRIRDTLSTAVQRLEENGWEVFDEPSGGNFIWTRVPHIEDSMMLVEQASKFGITLAPKVLRWLDSRPPLLAWLRPLPDDVG